MSEDLGFENFDLSNLLAERPTAIDETDFQDSGTVGKLDTSPTVLDLDRWNIRRGSQIADGWHDNGIAAHLDPLLVADAHAALFEPSPKFAENPSDKARAAWWQQLMETPEYRSLHNQTCLDNAMSELAAKNICDQWIEYENEQYGKGDQPEPGSDDESIESSLDRIRSTQQALQAAQQDVDTARDLSAGLGMGTEGGAIDRAALAKYFKQVKHNNQLRRILEMAGRMRKLCRSLQKQKTHATRGEITGIELGGDLSKLVPRERLAITGSVPELQDRAIYRLLRKRSLQYRHKKNEPQKSGPIVICVDESGSMSGERIVAAKGLAMAMAWLASYQKRWIALVGFAGGTEGTRLALPPKHNQQEALIEWLLHFYSGGTTLDVPLAEVPNVYWPELLAQDMPRGKTDLIIITDAVVDCPDEIRDNYKAWAAAEQVKTYGIVIGGGPVGDLAQVCDRYWSINELNLNNEAIEGVLSI